MPKQHPHEPVEQGSDNIFADLGFPNAEEHLVKAQLVFKIDAIMKKLHLKQVEAANLFGIRQPDVSKMLRGDFRQFSNGCCGSFNSQEGMQENCSWRHKES